MVNILAFLQFLFWRRFFVMTLSIKVVAVLSLSKSYFLKLLYILKSYLLFKYLFLVKSSDILIIFVLLI